MLTQSRLKELVRYDPELGIFIWLVYRKKTDGIGSRADKFEQRGYRYISVDNKQYLAHRVAWFYMTGEWPKDQIDHINNIRNDNRWVNLRESTNSENLRNTKARNKLGAKGVYPAPNNRYKALITLGTFDTIEEAKEAWDKAAKLLHKEFFYEK